ncbi:MULTISPECIES: protein YgfX [Photorhabdus]|uniref:Membrane protein n=1 Tax=Photorhabdus thracensis TaxID=230089 RepID=A0A0F7LQQ1_9GAMM|nr:protein YgfX [Photorhabdus thracensis]AKH64298.1 membrane protein [Photorhabdus thracensis]MCC8422333.1 protein YgfX [Photorhabdus thracensis]
MVLWKCDLRVSWNTQLISTCVHGAIAFIVLLAPWPADDSIFWLPLVLLVIASWGRSQKNIRKLQGPLVLLNNNKLQWKKHEWQIIRQPWMCRYGVLITAQSFYNRKKIRLWIASDSMPQDEWRNINQLLLQYPDT